MNLLISYNTHDSHFAFQLKKALEKYNFFVFLYEHQMDFGDDIETRLKKEILYSDFLLVIITPNSLYSAWVNWEIDFALSIERKVNKTKILPILMKGELLPNQLAGRVYADFRTPPLMNMNFVKLIEQLGRAIPFSGSHSPKINWAKINKDFYSEPELYTFKSTMIGSFYRSSGPGKPNFVNIGDKVRIGDVLCIVEAMKLFNELESEVSGKLVKILVDDNSPVEYDQPLMLIELAAEQNKN